MPTDRMKDDVSADMERIFKPLTGRMFVAVDDGNGQVSREPLSRGWRPIMLAAPVLVIVVSTVMAFSYARLDSIDTRAANAAKPAPASAISAPSSLPSSPAARSLVSRQAPLTATPAALSASTTIFVRQPAAEPRQMADLRPEGRARNVARPTSTQAPVPLLAVMETPSPPRAGEPDFAAGVAGLSSVGAERPSAVPPCEPGSEEDHCIYQDVLNADARLRLAYDRARRSSISDARLSAVGRRWRQAREDADYDPDGTIERYKELADALDKERRRLAQ